MHLFSRRKTRYCSSESCTLLSWYAASGSCNCAMLAGVGVGTGADAGCSGPAPEHPAASATSVTASATAAAWASRVRAASLRAVIASASPLDRAGVQAVSLHAGSRAQVQLFVLMDASLFRSGMLPLVRLPPQSALSQL